jgi:hypothetical protein
VTEQCAGIESEHIDAAELLGEIDSAGGEKSVAEAVLAGTEELGKAVTVVADLRDDPVVLCMPLPGFGVVSLGLACICFEFDLLVNQVEVTLRLNLW